MESKDTVKTIGIIIIALALMSFVSAEFWACFDYGERADYCGGYKPSKTCSSAGGCQWCMKEYRESEDCYVHGNWNKCNLLPQECSIWGNGQIDSDPPTLEIISPGEGELFTSRSVPLEFNLDEVADVYYEDLLSGRGRSTKICNNCGPGTPAYSRPRTFKEGLNSIQFTAIDVMGNPAYVNVSFFVDSKKPRVQRTEPRRGFADGNFECHFKEENPETLILHYGDDSHAVDVGSECELGRGNKYICTTYVDLSSYDGMDIEYWFELTDMAGNTDESKPREVSVDTTFPVINNPTNFWIQGEGRYSRYIYFTINITEENFDEAVYTYTDSRGRLRERRICSRLKDGMCEKRASFRSGHHDIQVNVLDKAGNMIGVPVSFDVDY